MQIGGKLKLLLSTFVVFYIFILFIVVSLLDRIILCTFATREGAREVCILQFTILLAIIRNCH